METEQWKQNSLQHSLENSSEHILEHSFQSLEQDLFPAVNDVLNDENLFNDLMVLPNVKFYSLV